MSRAWPWLAGAGSALALLGAGHCAYNLRRLVRPQPGATVSERVGVLIPARNEADRIGPTLASVLAQADVPRLTVRVFDDDSGDGTAEVVAAIAADDPRITILRGSGPPPPGWLGKAHACQRLADDALADDTATLVFIDADVVLEPYAINSAVRLLNAGTADLASVWPRQVASGALARLVQPLQQWSWATTLPLGAAARSRRPSLTAANGQFLIMTGRAYRAAGGHAAVADQILEDIELARAAKRAGCRVGIWDGSAIASCRMYDSAAELRAGYAKSLWAATGPRDAPLGARAAGAALAMGLLGLAYLVPPAALAAGPTVPVRLLGAAGYAAAVANRAMVAGRTGSPVWPDSLAQPVSIAALGALVLDSFLARAAGRTSWKGRPVSGAPRSAPPAGAPSRRAAAPPRSSDPPPRPYRPSEGRRSPGS